MVHHGHGFLAGGGLPQTYIPPANQADARAITASYIDDTVMPKIFSWSLGCSTRLYRTLPSKCVTWALVAWNCRCSTDAISSATSMPGHAAADVT